MTRLKSGDMPGIAADLDAYDAMLAAKTGLNLRKLACGAARIAPESFARRASSVRAFVVSMSCGQGIIAGFCEAVNRILAHLGFDAAVAGKPDAAGIEEAFRNRAGLIWLSDDERFLAVNIRKRRVVENAEATGVGFAWALNRMAGGVAGKPALVLGLGPVGQAAAATLVQLGADVRVYDLDPEKLRQVSGALAVKAAASLPAALKSCRLILDATPAANIFKPEDIQAETIVSAPGVPHGLSAGALRKIGPRFLHDSLELGVAVMAALSLKNPGD